MSVIEVQGLTKSFRTYKKNPGLSGAIKGLFHREYEMTLAVKDVSFSVEEGELVGFLGPNGAGKTTTLKMLSGLLYPTSGSAKVLGTIQSFRRDGGQFETIAPPGSVFSFALTINNAGVIGGAYVDSDFNFHGFLLRHGTYTTVDFPGAPITKIDSISDRGEISGEYMAMDGGIHGFVATPAPGG